MDAQSLDELAWTLPGMYVYMLQQQMPRHLNKSQLYVKIRVFGHSYSGQQTERMLATKRGASPSCATTFKATAACGAEIASFAALKLRKLSRLLPASLEQMIEQTVTTQVTQ